MDCANDPTVREVVLEWASQTTKTTTLENVIGYFIHADPAPILLVQPTVEMAQAWSKERLVPTLRDTPALRDIVANDKSRDSGNTIQLKTFPGGNLAIIGANAPAGLAGRPRRVVLLDEVDRFPASAGTEGDPVALAIRRTESFHNSVIYLTSTPTVKGFSRIESEYEQTDKRKWFVPCPTCGHWQTLEWRQVRWDEKEDGSPDVENTRYECAGRGCHWTDDLRRQAIQKGEWRPTAPFNGKRGYFLNGIYSPFKAKRGFVSRLHQMAVDFLEAKKGGTEQLKTWTNTFLAETWEEETDRIEAGPLLSRAEAYTPQALPPQIILITASADVQKDRIEVEVVGLGLDDESWGIEKRLLAGDTEQGDVWDDLAGVLATEYTRSDGVKLKISCAALDMRYKSKKVREFCRSSGFPRVYPVYGAAGNSPILVTTRFNKHYRLRTYAINSKLAKDTIFARLKVTEPGPRYFHFPKGHGYNEEHFRQLTAEVLKTKYLHGFPSQFYEKTRDRNEALDLRVYWLAGLDILRPNLAAIAKGIQPKEYLLKEPPADEPETLDTHPKPKQPKPPRLGGGFINSWKR